MYEVDIPKRNLSYRSLKMGDAALMNFHRKIMITNSAFTIVVTH